MTCYNGTLLGFCTDPIANAVPNKHVQTSSKLLRLPKAPKALLLQHTMVGKLIMVATRRLLLPSNFAPMTLNIVRRAPKLHGYLNGLMYLMSGLYWVVLIWHAKIHFYSKMRSLSSKNVHRCHLNVNSHLSDCLIQTFILQLGRATLFGEMQMSQRLSISTSGRAYVT